MIPRQIRSLAVLLAAGAFGWAAAGQVATTPAMAGPSPAAGIWLGTLDAGGAKLRVQLRLQTGGQDCALDSIDQQSFGIPCGNVQVNGSSISFDVAAVGGKFAGELSADHATITGTWTQGGALPLVLTRQQTAIEGPKGKGPDPAMLPVSLADLQSVLTKDLAGALTSGALAPETHAGVTIGVIEHGQRLIFCYGTAKPDSVYEIGSISKTFTATILAQMVEQGKVRLDEPVRELLPPGTVSKPDTGAEITLLDLSDQHSGLPRMPDNFHPADPANPYADYDAKALYEYVAKHGVALPANAPFGYSNLGVGLLGQALANAAKTQYPDLLHAEVTGPLNMRDTGIALTPEMQARFIQGYDGSHKPAHAWDLVGLAGAGGIRSTAADMLTYLQAELDPDALPASAQADADGKTLAAAIAMTHVIHADAGGAMHIALNWFRIDESGSYWHNGGTGGYSSYALFNPDKDFAVIVLSNTTVGPNSITDALGQHIAQRLSGLPAVSLGP
jgi:serine-type D-Ala-D-Ala carboxypeptidase/endopeptidase